VEDFSGSFFDFCRHQAWIKELSDTKRMFTIHTWAGVSVDVAHCDHVDF
jgi:hypothetical protein